LLFTPSGNRGIKQWRLLKGVAAISVDGKPAADPTKAWQKSAAEVLYIGGIPLVTIDKYSHASDGSNGSKYLAAGQTVDYYIDFSASNISALTYNTTITDTITVKTSPVDDPIEDAKITVVGASVEPNSVAGCQSPPVPLTGNVLSGARIITYTINNAIPGCTFRVKLSLHAADDITQNISITDRADIAAIEGVPGSSTFTTLAIPTYIQETVGGDIYAKKNLSFGQVPTGQYAGKYVLGSGGSIQPLTNSAQNWLLSGYGIRSGSTTDFSPDACTVSSSVCKAMNDNLTKLKKAANATINNIASGNINGTFPSPTPTNIPPEGWVYYYNGSYVSELTIGGPTTFVGRGTIIVENGNLHISGNMDYDINTPSILGIIVKNGSVIVDPNVTKINAIFYIYSDGATVTNNVTSGSFWDTSDPLGIDKQLVINGAVIASGQVSDTNRINAFMLDRHYIGTIVINADGTTSLTQEPAELFQYDSRIIVIPPPGFGGKIVGSM